VKIEPALLDRPFDASAEFGPTAVAAVLCHEAIIDFLNVNAAVDRLYAGSKLDELARSRFRIGVLRPPAERRPRLGSWGTLDRDHPAGSAASQHGLTCARVRCSHSLTPVAYFSRFQSPLSFEVCGMSSSIELQRQALRLLRAFQKIADRDSRRMVLLYIEEKLQKQEKISEGKPQTPA
jgi:hypothetical protein